MRSIVTRSASHKSEKGCSHRVQVLQGKAIKEIPRDFKTKADGGKQFDFNDCYLHRASAYKKSLPFHDQIHAHYTSAITYWINGYAKIHGLLLTRRNDEKKYLKLGSDIVQICRTNKMGQLYNFGCFDELVFLRNQWFELSNDYNWLLLI